MRQKQIQRYFRITLLYANGMTRAVNVKASSREVAEARALKRNPAAISVQGKL